MAPEMRAWGLAVVATFLFVLGGLGAWAQEYWAWIPRRLTDLLQLAGLVLSVWALVRVAQMLFARPAPERVALRRLAGTLGLAGVPPLVFLIWWAWLHVSLATAM